MSEAQLKAKRYRSLSAAVRGSKSELMNRADASMVHPSLIEVEPNWNPRGFGVTEEEYYARADVAEKIRLLEEGYERGDNIPPLVVRWVEEDGRILVRDGHHRLRALKNMIARGVEVKPILVIPATGNDLDDLANIILSNSNTKLTPIDACVVFYKLHRKGLKNQEIADRLQCSLPHVATMLKAYELPHEVKMAIQRGEITLNKALIPKEERLAKKQVKQSKKTVENILTSFGNIQPETVVPDDDGIVRLPIPASVWFEYLAMREASLKETKPAQEGEVEKTKSSDGDVPSPEEFTLTESQ